MRSKGTLVAALTFLTFALTAVVQARTVIQNKGSDTLVNVARAWAEEYRKVDPEVAYPRDRHDAELEISRAVGKGSTFTCRFPAARIVARREDTATAMPSGPRPSPADTTTELAVPD